MTALALALGICTFGYPARALAQAQPVRGAAYDLYAPDGETARRAQDGLALAAHQFHRYLGEAPPRIAVVLLDGRAAPSTPAGSLPVLYWFTAEGLAQARSHGQAGTSADTVRDRVFAESALPHEACHWYLAAYIAARTPAAPGTAAASGGRAGHVGAAGVPAWFNEGFATLCEPAEWQARRSELMTRELATAVPLAEFLSMRHPMAVSAPPGGAAARGAEQRMAAMKQGGDARAVLFYAQAHTLLRFLADREGTQFVGLVGRGLAAGESLTTLLQQAKQLPSDLGSLEQAWRAWVAAGPGKP